MRIPNLKNLDLAYETGVHIGDGTMIEFDNDFIVAYYGNYNTEKVYFKLVLIPLLQNIYGLKPKLNHFENSMFLRISSKELFNFKSNVIKLPIGNKSQLKFLPKIIMNNGKDYALQLIAGIFDTDGTVKLIKRHNGLYPRLRITLKNRGIIFQIKNILSKLGITSTTYHDRRYDKRINKKKDTWDLDINGFKNLMKFLQYVTIRNPHNIARVKLLLASQSR